MSYNKSAIDYKDYNNDSASNEIMTAEVMPEWKWIYGKVWWYVITNYLVEPWWYMGYRDSLTKCLFNYFFLATKSYKYVYKRYWSTT